MLLKGTEDFLIVKPNGFWLCFPFNLLVFSASLQDLKPIELCQPPLSVFWTPIFWRPRKLLGLWSLPLSSKLVLLGESFSHCLSPVLPPHFYHHSGALVIDYMGPPE